LICRNDNVKTTQVAEFEVLTATLKMEARCHSEILGHFKRTTLRYIAEDRFLQDALIFTLRKLVRIPTMKKSSLSPRSHAFNVPSFCFLPVKTRVTDEVSEHVGGVEVLIHRSVAGTETLTTE
jgi:hypothetical protein